MKEIEEALADVISEMYTVNTVLDLLVHFIYNAMDLADDADPKRSMIVRRAISLCEENMSATISHAEALELKMAQYRPKLY